MDLGLSFGKRKLIEKIITDNWRVAPKDKTFNYLELLFVIQEMLTNEGKDYLVEDRHSIKRGYHIFREFVKMLMYRNIANYDSMLLVTSEKGSGKSSAAIMIAREWCHLLGIKFDPARHIAYNNADVMSKIESLNKFEPLIADEAVRFACVDGNTLIKTKNGLTKIKYLAGKKNLKVYSYNKKLDKVELQIARKCVKTKVDMVFEVKFGNKKIIATKEHKFMTINGWRKLAQLKIGDKIVGI